MAIGNSTFTDILRPAKVNMIDSQSYLLVILDIETSGLSIHKDRILQLAARISCRVDDGNNCLPVSGGVADEVTDTDLEAGAVVEDTFNSFILPDDNEEFVVPEKIISLTGITSDVLKERGSSFSKVWSKFEAWLTQHSTQCGSKPIVLLAHNAKNFDIPFIHAELTRLQKQEEWTKKARVACFVDSLVFFRNSPFLWSSIPEPPKSYALGNMYKFIMQKELQGSHDAMIDVNALHSILQSEMLRDKWLHAANNSQFDLI